jgi:HEAT repeats
MKVRRGIPLVIGLALCLMLGMGLLRRTSEPRFKGKTITRWIETTSPFPDDEAVNAFGPDACPYLVRAIRRKQSALNRMEWALWKALPRALQIKYSRSRPVDVPGSRSCAHAWLASLGPDAQSAIPDLLEQARHGSDHFERSAAVNTLGMIGTGDSGLVQALIPLLEDSDQVVAAAAALSIPPLGPNGGPAVPTLINLIGANRPEKPFNPIMAFAFMGPAGAKATPLLVSALKDQQLAGPRMSDCPLGYGTQRRKRRRMDDLAVVAVVLDVVESAAETLHSVARSLRSPVQQSMLCCANRTRHPCSDWPVLALRRQRPGFSAGGRARLLSGMSVLPI